jgi:hypothetical protein
MLTGTLAKKSATPYGRKMYNRLWNGGTGSDAIKLFKKRKGHRSLSMVCTAVMGMRI